MALGQHEAIPLLPLGICRVYPQFLLIQIGKHIRSGQASAGMAALGCIGAVKNTLTHFAGHDLQFISFQFCHFLAS